MFKNHKKFRYRLVSKTFLALFICFGSMFFSNFFFIFSIKTVSFVVVIVLPLPLS